MEFGHKRKTSKKNQTTRVNMFLKIKKAKYIADYKIHLTFNDGKSGQVNLENHLDGEVFEPLKNIEYFKTFKVQGDTVSWDNGADLAPEFLYDLLK